MSRQLVKLRTRLISDKANVIYFLDYIDESGNRKRVSLGHSNKRKAEKQRAEKECELRNGMLTPESKRLEDFSEDSLERTADQIRESTREEYKAAMNDFIQTIGNIDYQKVTLGHGERYRQECLDRGNSPATVIKKLKHLKRLFQLAVNRRQLDENPFPTYRYAEVAEKEDSGLL